jgi:hypothetical protein
MALAAQILFIFIHYGSLFGAPTRGELPHSEYALVCSNTKEDHSYALESLQEQLIITLSQSDHIPDGYPIACGIIIESDPENPRANKHRCEPGIAGRRGSMGVLLDQDGSHIQGDLIDFPMSNPFLMEIFLVSSMTQLELYDDILKYKIPRIRINLPSSTKYISPELFRHIQEAVISMGATPI